MYCPNCGMDNRPGVRFCEDCGQRLDAGPVFHAESDTTPRRSPRTAPHTVPRAQPQTVIVQVGGRPRQINRTYLLVFFVLLLLLLMCGCLTYTEVLAAPRFLTDIFQVYTRIGIGCFSGILMLFIFYILILILNVNINLIFIPIGLILLTMVCCLMGELGMIELPYFTDWIVDEVSDPFKTLPWPFDPSSPDSPPYEKKPSGDCCPDFTFNNIHYDAGYLYFDINCRLESFKVQCVDGVVYDGSDNYWTAVSCCADPGHDNNTFLCEGLDYITAKTGTIRLEMEYEGTDGRTCIINNKFSPPTYPTTPDEDSSSGCPSGQSMCAGSCCSNGHCCDCGYGLSCYDDCSGCSP